MHRLAHLVGRVLLILVVACLLGRLGGVTVASAAPPKPIRLGVLATKDDGGRLAAARAGVEVLAAQVRARGQPVEVLALDDSGSVAGLKAALTKLKRARVAGVIVAPRGDLVDAYWKAVRSLRTPVVFTAVVTPDLTRNKGHVFHLGPTAAAEGVFAADALVVPIAAHRVGIVHEATPYGSAVAAAVARSLSSDITLAGIEVWPEAPEETQADAVAAAIRSFEADWVVAAVRGRSADQLVRTLARREQRQAMLFTDGNRRSSLAALAPELLEGCAFVGGPDPELVGRVGESVVLGLEERGAPVDVDALRAFEGARQIVEAHERTGGASGRKLVEAVWAGPEVVGALGAIGFERHHGIRLFPFALWRLDHGRYDTWPVAFLPTPGCGPPLGFGKPPAAEVNKRRGKIGYLTYGEGDTRTIEADLLELGLSTGGEDAQLDGFVRDELLARAIRVAHHLFRRDPDGTEIPGWSWGMSFTTRPPEDRPRSRTWLAIVAGDHPAAGGQVIGDGMVAVYSTFLKRTMYIQHALEPPLSSADRPLLDGTYRWGGDRARNRRIEDIRCLVDGLSSAMGLTLAHEFGHLCGCGHDTEAPTSIMNVVAGAGAAWADAVWIPSHQRSVTSTLGVEGMPK